MSSGQQCPVADLLSSQVEGKRELLVFYFMCNCVLPAYVCKSARGTGVTDSCELPCESWKLNPGPSKEHLVLLTTEHLSSTWDFLFL